MFSGPGGIFGASSLVSSSYNKSIDKKSKQMTQNKAGQEPGKAASVSSALRQLGQNICTETRDAYLFTA